MGAHLLGEVDCDSTNITLITKRNHAKGQICNTVVSYSNVRPSEIYHCNNLCR